MSTSLKLFLSILFICVHVNCVKASDWIASKSETNKVLFTSPDNLTSLSFQLDNSTQCTFVRYPFAYVADTVSKLYVIDLGKNKIIAKKSLGKPAHALNSFGDYVLVEFEDRRSISFFNTKTNNFIKTFNFDVPIAQIKISKSRAFICFYSYTDVHRFWIRGIDIKTLDYDTSFSGTHTFSIFDHFYSLVLIEDIPWLILTLSYDVPVPMQCLYELFPEKDHESVKIPLIGGSVSLLNDKKDGVRLQKKGNSKLFIQDGFVYLFFHDADDWWHLNVTHLKTGENLVQFNYHIVYCYPFNNGDLIEATPTHFKKNGKPFFPLMPTNQILKSLSDQGQLMLFKNLPVVCKTRNPFEGHKPGHAYDKLAKEDQAFYTLLAGTASHCQDLIYDYLPVVCVLDALTKTKDNKYRSSTEGRMRYPNLRGVFYRQLWLGNNEKTFHLLSLLLELKDPDVMEIYNDYRPIHEIRYWKDQFVRLTSFFKSGGEERAQ